MISLLNEKISLIDSKLKEILVQYNTLTHENLYEGMLYACFGGGKRIRPLLSLAICEDFKILLNDHVLNIATCIELIHSYSLVHDDLPGMDNDLIRRGKPTVHVKFGQGMAVLIGDALLNTAFEVMLNSINNINELNACKYIIAKAGVNGMIDGQAKDIMYNNESLDVILNIYEGKTSALFQASVVFPAIIMGLPQDLIDKLEKISNNLGVIFQLKDDLLDIDRQNEKLNTAKLSNKIEIENLILKYKKETEELLSCLNMSNGKFASLIKLYF